MCIIKRRYCRYHEDAQLGELLSDNILQAAQGVLNRLGSDTLLSSAVLTDLGNTAFSIASEQGLAVDAALQRGLKDACLAFMGQEAAPGLQRLVHVVSRCGVVHVTRYKFTSHVTRHTSRFTRRASHVSSIYFEELVFSRVQSEIRYFQTLNPFRFCFKIDSAALT